MQQQPHFRAGLVVTCPGVLGGLLAVRRCRMLKPDNTYVLLDQGRCSLKALTGADGGGILVILVVDIRHLITGALCLEDSKGRGTTPVRLQQLFSSYVKKCNLVCHCASEMSGHHGDPQRPRRNGFMLLQGCFHRHQGEMQQGLYKATASSDSSWSPSCSLLFNQGGFRVLLPLGEIVSVWYSARGSDCLTVGISDVISESGLYCTGCYSSILPFLMRRGDFQKSVSCLDHTQPRTILSIRDTALAAATGASRFSCMEPCPNTTATCFFHDVLTTRGHSMRLVILLVEITEGPSIAARNEEFDPLPSPFFRTLLLASA